MNETHKFKLNSKNTTALYYVYDFFCIVSLFFPFLYFGGGFLFTNEYILYIVRIGVNPFPDENWKTDVLKILLTSANNEDRSRRSSFHGFLFVLVSRMRKRLRSWRMTFSPSTSVSFLIPFFNPQYQSTVLCVCLLRSYFVARTSPLYIFSLLLFSPWNLNWS